MASLCPAPSPGCWRLMMTMERVARVQRDLCSDSALKCDCDSGVLRARVSGFHRPRTRYGLIVAQSALSSSIAIGIKAALAQMTGALELRPATRMQAPTPMMTAEITWASALSICPNQGGSIVGIEDSPGAETFLATFRRKIREAECWGRIGAFAIFCRPGRI